MYEEEIHQTLSRKDLQVVWQLMMKRTSWLQSSALTQAEADAALSETTRIGQEIRAVMRELEARMSVVRLRQRAAEAYEKGRHV